MRLHARVWLLGAMLVGCGRSAEPLRAALGPGDGPTTVWALTSQDGVQWSRGATAVAHRLSSLHACTVEGEVWVPALLQVESIPPWESAFPWAFVDVLRSRDLVHWTADRLPISGDTTGGVDPACVVGPDGLEMWFAELEGTTGDPAQGDRPSKIWRSRWNGSGFDRAEVMVRGTALIDPAPAYVDGELRIFLNQAGQRIVEARGDTLTVVWERATVPVVYQAGGRSWLLAQYGHDLATPRIRSIEPGGLGAERSLDLRGAVRNCESPSITAYGSGLVLMCVERR